MAERHTVFILGAGASVPYGFPTGWGLVKKICKEFPENRVITEQCASLTEPKDRRSKALEFTDALDKSGCHSIDTFLESRPDLRDDGKWIIAATMIPLEDEKSLSNVRHLGNDNWYQALFNWLFPREPQLGSLRKSSIVTFNYDRSLEHYFSLAFRHRFLFKDTQIADAMKQVPIIHVHGSFGKLPWQRGPEDTLRYGGTDDLFESAESGSENIKIIYEEEIDDSDRLKAAHAALKTANQIVFMGFGYDEINLARLQLQANCVPSIPVHGTVLGLVAAEQRHVWMIIRKQFPGCQRPNLIEKPNREFLRHSDWFQS